jgi:hypothetical protein
MGDQSNEQLRELTAEEADLVTGGALGRLDAEGAVGHRRNVVIASP